MNITYLLAVYGCAVFGFVESNGSISRTLYEGNFRHLRDMHGMSFGVSTTRSLEGNNYDDLRKLLRGGFPEEQFAYREPKSFKETFAIQFVPRDSIFPWRFRWTCTDPDEVPYEFLRQRAFYVITDSATHNMIRPDWRSVQERQYSTHEDFFQHLAAGSREIPLSTRYYEFDFASPYYAIIADGLCATYAAGLQVEPFGKFGDEIEKSGPKIVMNRISRFGRECFSHESEDLGSGSKFSSVTLGAPDFTVVERQQWSKTVKGWKQTELFEAKELDVFNGVTYPKKGVIKKRLYMPDEEGNLWLSVLEFTVDSVGKITTSIEKNWLPDLPKEGISFQKDNRVSFTPFRAETQQSYFFSDLNPSRNPNQRSNWYWIKFVVFASSLGLVALFLWRRYKANQD